MAPNESAGLFMGWVIEPGIRYRQQLIIADLENFKSGKFSRRLLKQSPETEVHFREKVVFPCAAVADANIERPLQRHAIGDNPEAPPTPVEKPSDATPTVASPELPDVPADFLHHQCAHPERGTNGWMPRMPSTGHTPYMQGPLLRETSGIRV